MINLIEIIDKNPKWIPYKAWLLRPLSWSFLNIDKSSYKLTLFLALVLLQRRTLHNEQYMIRMLTSWASVRVRPQTHFTSAY